MKLPGTWFLSLVLLCCLAPALGRGAENAGTGPAQDPLQRLTPEQRQKLLTGEAVYEYREAGEGQGTGVAMIIINAPAETCFKIFRELDKQSQYFPRKVMSEVVKSEGNKVLVHNRFDYFVATVEYYSQYTIDPQKRRFDFEMDKDYPHNVSESAGYFLFEQIDDRRTLFTYAATRLDIGADVPEFVRQYLISRGLPAQAVNVKKRIESGGKWRDK
jgi:hypothetical protein